MTRRAHKATAPATQFVAAGDTRFAFRRFGKPSIVALILLQRFRGTMDDWDPLFLEFLAREHDVVLLDNAGIGLSTGLVPASVAGMAHDVARFLDAAGLARVDVLGWSLGGCVAQQLALDCPDLVRRLVLAATGPGGLADAPRAPEKVLELMFKPRNDEEDFLYLFFPHTGQGRAEGLAHLRRLQRRDGGAAPGVGADGFMRQAAAIKAFTAGTDATLPRLREITQPVLVANGHADIMVPAYNSFVMAQRLPDAHLVLYPRAGHAFHFQNAHAFSAQVTAFLS